MKSTLIVAALAISANALKSANKEKAVSSQFHVTNEDGERVLATDDYGQIVPTDEFGLSFGEYDTWNQIPKDVIQDVAADVADGDGSPVDLTTYQDTQAESTQGQDYGALLTTIEYHPEDSYVQPTEDYTTSYVPEETFSLGELLTAANPEAAGSTTDGDYVDTTSYDAAGDFTTQVVEYTPTVDSIPFENIGDFLTATANDSPVEKIDEFLAPTEDVPQYQNTEVVDDLYNIEAPTDLGNDYSVVDVPQDGLYGNIEVPQDVYTNDVPQDGLYGNIEVPQDLYTLTTSEPEQLLISSAPQTEGFVIDPSRIWYLPEWMRAEYIAGTRG